MGILRNLLDSFSIADERLMSYDQNGQSARYNRKFNKEERHQINRAALKDKLEMFIEYKADAASIYKNSYKSKSVGVMIIDSYLFLIKGYLDRGLTPGEGYFQRIYENAMTNLEYILKDDCPDLYNAARGFETGVYYRDDDIFRKTGDFVYLTEFSYEEKLIETGNNIESLFKQFPEAFDIVDKKLNDIPYVGVEYNKHANEQNSAEEREESLRAELFNGNKHLQIKESTSSNYDYGKSYDDDDDIYTPYDVTSGTTWTGSGILGWRK